ncbi:unnamed protein product [Anisakis simplex]|uniref:VWFA domain-containing protein n=1 Tax=Anisakis simplex TaxID=6269 RepID=A0A0M3KAM1_ANISI|nr:unnamed protein product [Anisakis simplex]
MSDQRHDIASTDDAIKWWKQSYSNDENQNGKNVPKLNRKVPLTAGAAISLSILCIVLMLPGAELTIPSQKEKSHSMMLSLKTNQSRPSAQQDPPCSGYFAFVVDNSINTAYNYDKIVQSIAYVTDNWKLDEKLQLTAASAADGSIDANDFAKNITDWTQMLDDLSSMLGTFDPPLTPIQLASNISSEYCNSDSEFKIAQGGSVKFIIFTSVRDETEINKALNEQNPWLKCPLAGNESVFMVAVDGGRLFL